MNFRFDRYCNIGVFTFVGTIHRRYMKDLKMLLMHALDTMDRIVLNFGKDVEIEREFRELIGSACRISKSMDKPFIMNGYRLKAPYGAIQNAAAIYSDDAAVPLNR